MSVGVHGIGGSARRSSVSSRSADWWERLSRVLTLSAFGLALIALIAAPPLAVWWSKLPFPGFMVEQTLVVNDRSGIEWSGLAAGVSYPERVRRVNGFPVANSAEFHLLMANHTVGEEISLFVESPDGSARLYPSILLTQFSARDMWRLFWLPYLIGFAYLAIGAWVYRLRGATRPGRVLGFFCACTAIICLLIFDTSTTHMLTALWTVAVAMLGGGLISLSLRFPQEVKPVQSRPWVLAVPYFVSIVLGLWGLSLLYDTAEPWAYVGPWGTSYRYAALGIIIFLGMMLYRAVRGQTPLVKRQARIVLFGSLLAFGPVTIWFLAPVFYRPITFNPVIFLPALLLFPLSVAVAILRYRLMEVDAFVNRALVYGVLTAVLAGVFSTLTVLLQRGFIAVTGEKSDAAPVIIALVVVSAVQPIRSRVEGFMARRFKEPPDHTRSLRDFRDQVRAFVQMSSADQIACLLLEQAAQGLQAESGAVTSVAGGRWRTVHTYGPWRGNASVSVPIEFQGMRYGVLLLGAKNGDRPYSRTEGEALQRAADEVARAIYVDSAVRDFRGSIVRAEDKTLLFP